MKISLNEPVYIDTKLPKLPTLVRCVANVFPEYFQVMMIMENERFTIIEKIRQINYLVNSLVKPLLSRNFCQKNVRVNFRNFHTVRLKYKRTILRENDIQCKVQSVAFTEFLQ